MSFLNQEKQTCSYFSGRSFIKYSCQNVKYYGYVAKFQLGFRVEFLEITVVHFYFHPPGDFNGFIIEVFASRKIFHHLFSL